MKLTDRAKKRLTLAGLGVVCVILVIAIASQFKAEELKDVSVQPSSTVSDAVNPGNPSTGPTNTQEVNAKPIDSTVAPAQSTDTGDSTGTEQSIQVEITKPDTVTPLEKDKITKPYDSASSSRPKSGDKNEKGQTWVPGFGWVDDSGPNVGTQVGNDDDELTGNKVGSMD